MNIIFLGNTNVGKTSIVDMIVKDKYNTISYSTIGAIFSTKIVKYKDIEYELDFWDTGGQEIFNSIVPLYF